MNSHMCRQAVSLNMQKVKSVQCNFNRNTALNYFVYPVINIPGMYMYLKLMQVVHVLQNLFHLKL